MTRVYAHPVNRSDGSKPPGLPCRVRGCLRPGIVKRNKTPKGLLAWSRRSFCYAHQKRVDRIGTPTGRTCRRCMRVIDSAHEETDRVGLGWWVCTGCRVKYSLDCRTCGESFYPRSRERHKRCRECIQRRRRR